MNPIEYCRKCETEEDDLRTLWMSCFYEMNELALPFAKVQNPLSTNLPREFYTLRVCKNCRSEWMESIQAWWILPTTRESCGSGIFIRRFGANVEVTDEEFRQSYPGIEPVRVIQDE